MAGHFSVTKKVIGAVFACALAPTMAFAQSCATGPQAKSPAEAQELVQTLAKLVASPNRGGGQIGALVRDAVSADPALVSAVLQMTNGSDARIARMIGAGLASAASACAKTQPEAALRIQQGVVSTANAEMLQAFQVATNDVRTAAIESAVAASPVAVAPAGGLGGVSGSSAFGGGTFRAPAGGRAGGVDAPSNPLANVAGGSGGSPVSIIRNSASSSSVSPSR